MRQVFLEQVNRLVALGYAESIGVGRHAFGQALAGLAHYLPDAGAMPAPLPQDGKLPFALVINSPALPIRAMLPLVERRGKRAIERLTPIEPERFQPIDDLGLPPGHAYLLLDIDRGMETRNATPLAALGQLQAQGRTPITVEEGIALLTHYPEFLQPNHCFLMLGSRCGDKRVPALWLSENQPRLGWCWAGNPHTWLGAASCLARSPAVSFTPLQAAPPQCDVAA